MTPKDRAMMVRMQQELAELRRATRLIPVRWGGGDTVVTPSIAVFQMVGGNSVGTIFGSAVLGMKASSIAVQSVPAKVPSLSATYADGLGYALALVNGAVSGIGVWIASKVQRLDAAAATQDYGGLIIQDNAFVSVSSFRVHVAGSANNAVLAAVLTGGVITSVTITSGGSGYTADSLIYVTGGGGSGAVLSPVITSGAISGVTILNGGSGHTSTPTLDAWGNSALVWLPFYV
jgi:hypothetical protein